MSVSSVANSPGNLDSAQSTVSVEGARERQTAPPATPFRNVLATGVSALMTGAEVATQVVGGPVLAAAVHEARTGAVAGLSPTPIPATTAGAAGVSTAGGNSDIVGAHAMQRESQSFNLQLLALQQEVQDENRRFTTLTNVVRAKHDTAKAAVGNIRS